MHFNGDKFRKIKANERRHTCRITREFNADFTNFAPLKLNGVQILLGYPISNYHQEIFDDAIDFD